MSFEFIEAGKLMSGLTLPQLGMLFWLSIGLIIHLAWHGQPRPRGNALVTVVSGAIEVGILFLGGFFQVFDWPQALWAGWFFASLCACVVVHGKAIGNYSFPTAAFSVSLYVLVLAWAGFFS